MVILNQKSSWQPIQHCSFSMSFVYFEDAKSIHILERGRRSNTRVAFIVQSPLKYQNTIPLCPNKISCAKMLAYFSTFNRGVTIHIFMHWIAQKFSLFGIPYELEFLLRHAATIYHELCTTHYQILRFHLSIFSLQISKRPEIS